LAIVRFTLPFSRIAGATQVKIEAATVGELCQRLIERYGPEMKVLLDDNGEVSRHVVFMVNRRNIHTLHYQGELLLDDNTEVLIMPHIIGG
jgi:molybdopterin converting factor small subunit